MALPRNSLGIIMMNLSGSFPRYHDAHYPSIFTLTFYQIFMEFTARCLARHTVSVPKHSTQHSSRFIPAI